MPICICPCSSGGSSLNVSWCRLLLWSSFYLNISSPHQRLQVHQCQAKFPSVSGNQFTFLTGTIGLGLNRTEDGFPSSLFSCLNGISLVRLSDSSHQNKELALSVRAGIGRFFGFGTGINEVVWNKKRIDDTRSLVAVITLWSLANATRKRLVGGGGRGRQERERTGYRSFSARVCLASSLFLKLSLHFFIWMVILFLAVSLPLIFFDSSA